MAENARKEDVYMGNLQGREKKKIHCKTNLN